MVCSSADPEPALSPVLRVVEVGGLGSEACDRPALEDGGPGVALGVIAAGRADGAGSLISQAVAGAITVTKAAARAGMARRRFPRHRGGASADATWPGVRCESVNAVTAILWLFQIAECPATKEPPRGNTEDGSPAPTIAPGFEMLVAGTFTSWSRNPAALGRSAGSLLRAVISTSIKCKLTPGTGPIGLLATPPISP